MGAAVKTAGGPSICKFTIKNPWEVVELTTYLTSSHFAEVAT